MKIPEWCLVSYLHESQPPQQTVFLWWALEPRCCHLDQEQHLGFPHGWNILGKSQHLKQGKWPIIALTEEWSSIDPSIHPSICPSVHPFIHPYLRKRRGHCAGCIRRCTSSFGCSQRWGGRAANTLRCLPDTGFFLNVKHNQQMLGAERSHQPVCVSEEANKITFLNISVVHFHVNHPAGLVPQDGQVPAISLGNCSQLSWVVIGPPQFATCNHRHATYASVIKHMPET